MPVVQGLLDRLPAGVDMATYKSEFFSHYYDGTRRPVSHYSLGWLPRWLRVTGLAAPLVNAVLRTSLAKRAAALGGISPDRYFRPSPPGEPGRRP